MYDPGPSNDFRFSIQVSNYFNSACLNTRIGILFVKNFGSSTTKSDLEQRSVYVTYLEKKNKVTEDMFGKSIFSILG